MAVAALLATACSDPPPPLSFERKLSIGRAVDRCLAQGDARASWKAPLPPQGRLVHQAGLLLSQDSPWIMHGRRSYLVTESSAVYVLTVSGMNEAMALYGPFFSEPDCP